MHQGPGAPSTEYEYCTKPEGLRNQAEIVLTYLQVGTRCTTHYHYPPSWILHAHEIENDKENDKEIIAKAVA